MLGKGKILSCCLNQPVNMGDEFLRTLEPRGDLLGLEGDKIIIVTSLAIIEQKVIESTQVFRNETCFDKLTVEHRTQIRVFAC